MKKQKAKAEKSRQTSPALILFGLVGGKPKAGTFVDSDAEAATKAAHSLGLAALKVSGAQAQDLAAKLSAGQVHSTGRGFVPFIRRDLFEQLKDLAKAQGIETNEPAASDQTNSSLPVDSSHAKSPHGHRLPKTWDEIQPDDLVLAQDVDLKDGWWQAVVTKKNGDMYSLRWQQAKSRRVMVKHKYNLALMWPGKSTATSADPKTLSAAVASANWETIGANQLVLAKEEGPMEQWWEATTIEAQDDRFILKWRDYSHLPPFIRPRIALALIYPVPSGPKAKASASS